MKIDTSIRTNKTEIMDDFDLQGAELKRTLKDLENINKWLGGNIITIKGVQKLIEKSEKPKDAVHHIIDVGCGNGAMLRKLAEWGRTNKYNLKLTGIDANPFAITIAQELSENYQELEFETQNIFNEEFKSRNFDILLCTLTLHHFKDQEIIELLQRFYDQVNMGIVINDLHRSKAAYRLFQAFCGVFVNNEIARKDGLTSILRGFKKEEIQHYSSCLSTSKQEINWKWAYRYQWIIEKENK